jgi:acetyl esterase/lipase
MSSFQSHLLRFFVKMQRRSVDFNAPVSDLHATFERTGRMMKPPQGIRVHPVIAGGVLGEWVESSDMTNAPVILYLHGGGYAMGSPNTHRALAARIALASHARALVLDYRLAPEHPFPAALEDAVAAYRWLLAHGTPPEQIVFAGDSAGGGLALAALLALRDADDPMPAGVVCMSPLTDMEGTGESVITRAKADPFLRLEDRTVFRHYLGNHDPREPLLSPLYGDLRGLPPMLIQVGNDEIMLSDSTRFTERARTAGVDVTLNIYDGMWHVFQYFAPYLPEAVQAIGEIGAFVRARCSQEISHHTSAKQLMDLEVVSA